MKSALQANSTTVRLGKVSRTWDGFSLKKMRVILLLLLISNFGYAQQKSLNATQLQQDLSEVNEDLQKINQKIDHINYRLTGIPPESVDPELATRLNDLQIKKVQLEKRKISIQAALNAALSTNDPNDSPDMMESDHSTPYQDEMNQ